MKPASPSPPRFRRSVLVAALACAPLALGCAGPSGPSARPAPGGILLLVLDCLRADYLGSYGAELPASPRLDALAAESVLFERAWSQGSWTRPSLPTLLTGLYPSEHGLTDEFELGAGRSQSKLEARTLAPEAETLAEGLAAKGYRTALFGDQGQLSRTFRLDQGFGEYRSRLGSAEHIRSRFETWLGAQESAPFFAYLHFLDLHWPYCPRDTYGALDPGSRNFCANWRELGIRLFKGDEKLSPADLRALRARYAEELLGLDAELGKLFDTLRARGRFDETLIVVTSDHGEELFDHGRTRHGHTLYEELLHVPFVWKLPKSWAAPGGRRIPGLVETRSLAPTLLEAAGAAIPQRVTAPSLLPWLLDPQRTGAPVEAAVAESNGMYAVRDERYKLIVDTGRKTTQLFDLVADPAETRDLAPSDRPRVAELERRLRAWRERLDPLPLRAGEEVDAASVEELRALGYIQ